MEKAIDGVKEAINGVEEAIYGVEEATNGVRVATDGAREAIDGMREAIDGVREAIGGIRTPGQGQGSQLLAAACGTYELGARMSRNTAYRAAVGLATVAGFLLVWINLAVGIIGDEGNPANLMFGGVLVVGVIGALVARFRAPGMARAYGNQQYGR